MLLSRRFIKNVLSNSEFHKRVLSVVVDEAHVVSHWGHAFHKKYRSLGMVRAFLLRSTPVVALSATLAARVRRDVLDKLQFGKGGDYVNIDVGNDRPNVSIVIWGIHNPLNTYADLDFVVAMLADDPSQIPKTFIYADNIAVGQKIIEHLNSLLPESLQHSGIIRPYNAAYGEAYRKKVMALFTKGDVRILICTDAAGMVSFLP
jgi:superfamily II DNA helicase RecQ